MRNDAEDATTEQPNTSYRTTRGTIRCGEACVPRSNETPPVMNVPKSIIHHSHAYPCNGCHNDITYCITVGCLFRCCPTRIILCIRHRCITYARNAPCEESTWSACLGIQQDKRRTQNEGFQADRPRLTRGFSGPQPAHSEICMRLLYSSVFTIKYTVRTNTYTRHIHTHAHQSHVIFPNCVFRLLP